MDIPLNFINQSNDSSSCDIVIFQKIMLWAISPEQSHGKVLKIAHLEEITVSPTTSQCKSVPCVLGATIRSGSMCRNAQAMSSHETLRETISTTTRHLLYRVSLSFINIYRKTRRQAQCISQMQCSFSRHMPHPGENPFSSSSQRFGSAMSAASSAAKS